ncbi:MAG: prenyltransferase, partial [Enterobacteriaceae bacterium]|nr:prenyltransferase [Enterobacteriaceae bacterium]
GYVVLCIGLFTAFSIYFYSASPVHFASRYGMGEFLHIICLGPLLLVGCVFSIVGYFRFCDLLIGFPFGLLITGCLLINEYPDSKADLLSGKINLAVLLGNKYIPYLFSIFVVLSYLIILFGIIGNCFTYFYLFTFSILPYVIRSVFVIFKIGTSRASILEACAKSLNIYLFFSLLLVFSRILELIFFK